MTTDYEIHLFELRKKLWMVAFFLFKIIAIFTIIYMHKRYTIHECNC